MTVGIIRYLLHPVTASDREAMLGRNSCMGGRLGVGTAG